ncbi:MAG: hypothetical protein AB1626_04950 [Candidatus Micrarchaeota archaeon]
MLARSLLWLFLAPALLLFGCAEKAPEETAQAAEAGYLSFAEEAFSVAYPPWPQQPLGENLLAVGKDYCSVAVKKEDFPYLPRAFESRAEVIALALERGGFIFTEKDIRAEEAKLDFTKGSGTSGIHGVIRLIPCSEKIYWVMVSCPSGGNDSFFERVLDSAECSVPPSGLREEACPPATLGFAQRKFLLATTTSSAYKTGESWALAMERLPDVADVMLWMFIPKYEEFLPGHAVSENTSGAVEATKIFLETHGVDLFVGIDPTSGLNRSKLYELNSRHTTFADPDFRQTFKSAAVYYARELRPKYMALGIEINMYYPGNEEDFENYLSLYRETRREVKRVSPDTKVFATMQLEDMQALWLAPTHNSTWYVLEEMDDDMDLVVLSTYPSLVYASPSQIPADYFSRVREHTSLPIAVGETGYPTGDGVIGDRGSQQKQNEYLARLLREADELDMEFVTWITMYDPEWEDLPEVLKPFEDMGLRHANDTPKQAWCVMKAAKDLSYRS